MYVCMYLCIYTYIYIYTVGLSDPCFVYQESLVSHLTDFIKSHQTLLLIARFYEARKRSILRKQAKYPKKVCEVK